MNVSSSIDKMNSRTRPWICLSLSSHTRESHHTPNIFTSATSTLQLFDRVLQNLAECVSTASRWKFYNRTR